MSSWTPRLGLGRRAIQGLDRPLCILLPVYFPHRRIGQHPARYMRRPLSILRPVSTSGGGRHNDTVLLTSYYTATKTPNLGWTLYAGLVRLQRYLSRLLASTWVLLTQPMVPKIPSRSVSRIVASSNVANVGSPLEEAYKFASTQPTVEGTSAEQKASNETQATSLRPRPLTRRLPNSYVHEQAPLERIVVNVLKQSIKHNKMVKILFKGRWSTYVYDIIDPVVTATNKDLMVGTAAADEAEVNTKDLGNMLFVEVELASLPPSIAAQEEAHFAELRAVQPLLLPVCIESNGAIYTASIAYFGEVPLAAASDDEDDFSSDDEADVGSGSEGHDDYYSSSDHDSESSSDEHDGSSSSEETKSDLGTKSNSGDVISDEYDGYWNNHGYDTDASSSDETKDEYDDGADPASYASFEDLIHAVHPQHTAPALRRDDEEWHVHPPAPFSKLQDNVALYIQWFAETIAGATPEPTAAQLRQTAALEHNIATLVTQRAAQQHASLQTIHPEIDALLIVFIAQCSRVRLRWPRGTRPLLAPVSQDKFAPLAALSSRGLPASFKGEWRAARWTATAGGARQARGPDGLPGHADEDGGVPVRAPPRTPPSGIFDLAEVMARESPVWARKQEALSPVGGAPLRDADVFAEPEMRPGADCVAAGGGWGCAAFGPLCVPPGRVGMGRGGCASPCEEVVRRRELRRARGG